jgi:hypothetical protein
MTFDPSKSGHWPAIKPRRDWAGILTILACVAGIILVIAAMVYHAWKVRP